MNTNVQNMLDSATPVKYDAMRFRLKSGDVVFFEYHDFPGKLCRLFTGSYLSHCAIVWCVEDRVMLIEQHRGGQRIINLSWYFDKRRPVIHVLRPYIPWESYKDNLLGKTGFVPYGYLDYVSIGLKEAFGLRIKDFKGEVCSEMIARCLRLGGMNFPHGEVISPTKLLEYINTPILYSFYDLGLG